MTNLTMVRNNFQPEFITVSGEGFEVDYFERGQVGSKTIRRCTAAVGEYSFREYDGSWKKNGRGGVKNADDVYAKLDQADEFMRANGYGFNHTR